MLKRTKDDGDHADNDIDEDGDNAGSCGYAWLWLPSVLHVDYNTKIFRCGGKLQTQK